MVYVLYSISARFSAILASFSCAVTLCTIQTFIKKKILLRKTILTREATTV